MTATTDILQFAGSGGANVLSQSDYAALTAVLADGYSAGILPSDLLNKSLRQALFMAAGLANFCVQEGISVPDDGNLAGLVAEITAALNALKTNPVGVNVTSVVGTDAFVNVFTPLTVTVPAGGAALFVDAYVQQAFAGAPSVTKLQILVDGAVYSPLTDVIPLGLPFLSTRAFALLVGGTHSIAAQWYGATTPSLVTRTLATMAVYNAQG